MKRQGMILVEVRGPGVKIRKWITLAQAAKIIWLIAVNEISQLPK